MCVMSAALLCDFTLQVFQRATWSNDRERASGVYGTAAYFVATVAWDFLPMRIAPTALFAGLTYTVMGLRPGLGRVLGFFTVLVLTNLAGTAMSMAIGANLPFPPPFDTNAVWCWPVHWGHLRPDPVQWEPCTESAGPDAVCLDHLYSSCRVFWPTMRCLSCCSSTSARASADHGGGWLCKRPCGVAGCAVRAIEPVVLF